jgi:hypothetical protein
VRNSFDEVDKAIFERNPVLGKPTFFCCQNNVPYSSHRPCSSHSDSVKLPGDLGFDPFNLASDKATLLSHRAAELRHARLAMLAAVGWPLSEILQPRLAAMVGMEPILTPAGQVPSVLNGGLGNVPPLFWVGAFGLAAVLELQSLDREKAGASPGDLGFDPLGFSSDAMANAELANGRVAMLAITGFAIQEVLYNLAIINETPVFFRPLLSPMLF